jgi:hypothetical protein
MFRKQPQEEQFQVLPAGTIVYKDGHYYRVHDYGLVEVPAPLPLEQPTPEAE